MWTALVLWRWCMIINEVCRTGCRLVSDLPPEDISDQGRQAPSLIDVPRTPPHPSAFPAPSPTPPQPPRPPALEPPLFPRFFRSPSEFDQRSPWPDCPSRAGLECGVYS